MMSFVATPGEGSDLAGRALELLFLVAWRGSLLIAMAALLAALMRWASAATRHLVWAAAMFGVLVLPLLTAGMPRWELPRPEWMLSGVVAPAEGDVSGTRASHGVESAGLAVATRAGGAGRPDQTVGSALSPDREAPARGAAAPPGQRNAWLLWLWAAGAMACLLRVVFQAVGLRRLLETARPIETSAWLAECERLASQLGIRSAVRLLRSRHTRMPLTWGVRRASVMLPDDSVDWSDEQRHNVLLHELAHVRRRDCLTQSLAEIVCVINWFNPLVWIAAGRMRMEREHACDDRVLMAGVRPSSYAENLVDIATAAVDAQHPSPAVPMAGQARISDRVASVLDARARHRWPGRWSGLALVALVAVAAVSVAALSVAEPAPQQSRSGEKIRRGLSGAEAAIAAANEKFAAAFRDGDVAALLELYSPEAVIHRPFGAPLQGHRDIEEHYEFVLESGLIASVDIGSENVDVVGDTAHEVGRYTSYDRWGERFSTGSYMTIWRHEDGAWKVHREMISVEVQGERGAQQSRRRTRRERQ